MVNYHKHSDFSNLTLADSICTNEQYAQRAVELGHKVLSSCEHGNAGVFLNTYEIAEKHNLKFLYAAEPYYVRDRKEKDNTNCHMILAAKTMDGIKDINYATSMANIDGFYYRPRIDDELIFSLSPKDVLITTACIAGIWKYGHEKAEELIKKFKSHFGDSFMLEVQAHNDPDHRDLNTFILKMYRKYNIPLIAATDSHYIYPQDAMLRDEYQKSKGMVFNNENEYLLDYPDENTLFQRFKDQGVLSPAQIKEAISNTDVFLDFDDIVFTKEKKVPTIYPELTQEERNKKYTDLVMSKWEEYSQDMTEEEKEVYWGEDGIGYEIETITSTNMSDYFLLTYEIVERAKKKGGLITSTGRGSAIGFFTNMLLGFTSVDRFKMPVETLPDRFISADRIISGAFPDLDLNIGNLPAYEEAMKELLGEKSFAPMCLFGTLQKAAAFRVAGRALGKDESFMNGGSEQIKSFVKLYENAEEDEKEELDIYKYVDSIYHDCLKKSEDYIGMVGTIGPHPCAYLITNGDILRDFGIIRIKSDTGQRPLVFAVLSDGSTLERFGMLKEDVLRVDIVSILESAYRKVGIPMPSVSELIELTKGDKETWRMYSDGLTLGLNQVEQYKTKTKVMRYKPTNISELSAFIAAIRPGFASMLEQFLERKHFDYGIPIFDKLIQTKEMSSSWLIYQEQIMKTLRFAGFSGPESYLAIKAISKKKLDKILELKPRFMKGFSEKLVESDKAISSQLAEKTSTMVWKILEDNSLYSFNSAHSCCMAADSLYAAYCKAHYPLEFYAAMFEVYGSKGNMDKKKIGKIKAEMRKGFGITLTVAKFGQDNRNFYMDRENNSIVDSLVSCKFMSQKIASFLYSIKDNKYSSFVDLLVELEHGPVDARQTKILITMGYFEKFGKEKKLLTLYSQFKNGKMRYGKTQGEATKQKRIEALKAIENELPDEGISVEEKMRFEVESYGTPISVFKSEKQKYTVLEVNPEYSPKIDLYSVSTGATGRMKVKKEYFNNNPIAPGDTIMLHDWTRKPAKAKINGEFVNLKDKYENWMVNYEIL